MPKILIVEDTPSLRIQMEKILSSDGYAVTSTGSGHQALKSIAEQPVDLVVTDIYMPQMDGFELMAALRRDHPEAKIIAVSADPLKVGTYSVAKCLGAISTLSKPFTAQELSDAVARTIGPADAEPHRILNSGAIETT